ncbi:MAG: AraC family transcriptional regulator [Bacteroidaceae bacterium]|nr:AraC family transcriptional regulator [Bacteroidaceae bacterium]
MSEDSVSALVSNPIPEETTSTQPPIRHLNTGTVLPGKEIRKEDIAFLTKVAEIYDQNLGLNRFSIDSIASEMCMSRTQFTRRIYAVTGMTENTYFNRIRLEKAQRLLKDSDRPVNVIAMECGFEDTSYFNNLFKKYFKVTPMQYRIMPEIPRPTD